MLRGELASGKIPRVRQSRSTQPRPPKRTAALLWLAVPFASLLYTAPLAQTYPLEAAGAQNPAREPTGDTATKTEVKVPAQPTTTEVPEPVGRGPSNPVAWRTFHPRREQ